MKIMKKISLITLSILLILPSFIVLGAAENQDDEEAMSTSDNEGSVTSKDEIVYATLHANGDDEEIYIVNSLEVNEAGKVTDYGNYNSIENLTDLKEMEQDGEEIEVEADEGRFYYQGNLDTAELPWNFDIRYLLDGKEVSTKELAGADGELEITIHSEANEEADSVFFENYLLEISFAVDAETTKNIQTEEGMLANAGKNIQVTFTVMPEEEGELAFSADVTDFAFDGIDINAVPSTMNIDEPDTDELTSDMRTLADAVSGINDGVLELESGATEINAGANSLADGSAAYLNGITSLDNGSAELVNGSASIQDAVAVMYDGLERAEAVDLSELEVVIDGLTEISGGLGEISDAITQLQSGYSEAYQVLEGAINNIPAPQLSEEDIAAIYQSDANPETVDQLVTTYEAAQTVKGTFEQTQEAFSAVEHSLPQMSETLDTMSGQINLIVEEFSGMLADFDPSSGVGELTAGFGELLENYTAFHSGLVEYTNGVGALASNYQEINNGITELSNGTREFENGLGSLQEGTSDLADATNDMPEQMTEEIDQMISEYDKSDFEAVSFISPRNENVNSVQFVLTTESIEMEETGTDEGETEEDKSLWERFLDLFSF